MSSSLPAAHSQRVTLGIARIGSQAVRALLSLLVASRSSPGAAARTSGCERRHDHDDAASRSARASSARQRATPRRARRRRSRSTASQDVRADVRHELRLVHGHARSRARAEHGRVARRARQRRLLRQHDLPSRRSGVRHPGRRSDTDRRGRAGLLDRRQAAIGREVHEGHRRDGEVAGTRRPERRAASSSS